MVGFKPTVGLVSRTHIVPISVSQDTAGPITRTVHQAAELLSVIAGSDPADSATRQADAHRVNFAAALSPNSLRGARLGVLRFASTSQLDPAFEAALARVQGRLGLIPAEAAEEIDRACRIERIDMARLRSQTERAGTPIVGLVSQINALCRDGFGEYCHWGATTQDVTDTATVLQIRASLEIVDAGLTAIATALAALAQKHRLTPMAGRTHLQQAVPVSFGYKMAGLLSAVQRHRERLAQLAAELGLAQPVIAWHTQRDTIAEVGAFLGLVGGTLGKLSMDVKLLMQTEVGEVFEPFAPGRGASSTMPQKRNPISCTYIHAQVAVLRQHAASLMEAMVGDHERATGPWQIEWIVLPEAFCLAAGALAHSRSLVEGLEVDAERMRANLDLTHGLVVAEAVMMGLAPGMGRERAHDLVYDLCRVAIAERRALLDVLVEADR